MKKYFRWPILRNAALLIAGLSVLLALINLALYDGGTFYVGFPGRFLTLYLDKPSPSFHVSESVRPGAGSAAGLCDLLVH